VIPSRVPLGILPGGTANVLANELGLGNGLERAIARLGPCEERRVAVGKLCTPFRDPRYFLLMAGAGLDATIVTKVNPALKSRAGKLAYWAAGLGQFFSTVGQFQSKIDGRETKNGFALVSRVRNYGGDMEIASNASLLNNDFEVVLFEGSNPLRYAAYMTAVTLRQVKSMPGVSTARTQQIEFSGSADLQIDGEYAGRLPASLEIAPDALTLLIPSTYR
jgi:diacylglycerol kinase (ATP)